MKITNLLSVIYGNEAIYLQTFKKAGQDLGIGYVTVNPAIWKRNEEPSFAGEIQDKKDNKLITTLTVTKDHMKGHFRPDIAHLLPGHKSIRTASIALGRFLNPDRTVDPQKIYLSKYDSVKFLSPILPGQTLNTVVTLTGSTENFIQGDAVQSVDGKESMQIRGMTVKQIKRNKRESILFLDQLIEAAAQTVGLYVLDSLQSTQVLPLFHGTEHAELLKNVHSDDNLLIKTNKVRVIKAKTMSIFISDLQIYRTLAKTQLKRVSKTSDTVNEELIAEIKNLQGLLMPKDEVLAKLT